MHFEIAPSFGKKKDPGTQMTLNDDAERLNLKPLPSEFQFPTRSIHIYVYIYIYVMNINLTD